MGMNDDIFTLSVRSIVCMKDQDLLQAVGEIEIAKKSSAKSLSSLSLICVAVPFFFLLSLYCVCLVFLFCTFVSFSFPPPSYLSSDNNNYYSSRDKKYAGNISSTIET